jgi:hypothetical protein
MGLVTGSAVADAAPAQPMRLPARVRRFVDQSPDFLKPDLTFEPRTTDRETARYVRSFLIMRIVVGALGVLLPLSLVLIGRWLDGEPWFRDSLSAYYYSGVRELFVGVLSAIGVFLFTYKVSEHSLDNTLSFVAAAAVVFVVLFPTGPPAHVTGLTPLQEELGESRVQTIHFAAALLFIVSLAVISFFYGVLAAVPLGLRSLNPGGAGGGRARHAHRMGAERVGAHRRVGGGLGIRRLVADEGPGARLPSKADSRALG